MKINLKQRVQIMKLWAAACKMRGWKSSDRTLRLATFSKLIGREIDSADDIGRIDECTKLMNELKVIIGVSIQAGVEADNPYINKARVLRNQIAAEIIPCLELYIEDVRAYITSIMEHKNRWWKMDRPARDMTIMDLSAEPVRKWSVKQKRMAEWPSPLEQLQYTLAARLNTLRNEADDTIHDMKIKAGVPCHCATICAKQQMVAAINLPHPEPELEGQPF